MVRASAPLPYSQDRVMRLLFALLLLTLASSCASIMNSNGFKTIEVSSNPPGASFTSDAAGVTGVTPAAVQMPNGKPVTFRFTLDGHEPQQLVARPRMSGWVVGNILFGGIIGLVIDVVNDNSMIHRDVSVNLLPLEQPAPSEEDSEQPAAEGPATDTSID